MRLTKKSDKLGYCLRHSSISANKCWNKLGQLEDIEEELSIDLLVREQALRNGFYYIDEQGNIVRAINYLSNKSYGFVCAEYEYISYYEVCLNELRKECNFYYKDYGKTWAVDKKDLTKGNCYEKRTQS